MKEVVNLGVQVASVFCEIDCQAVLIVFVFLSGVLIRTGSAKVKYPYIGVVKDRYTLLVQPI